MLTDEQKRALMEYVEDDFPSDCWDCDTATETPIAMNAPGPKKRSGEWVKAEFDRAVRDSKTS